MLPIGSTRPGLQPLRLFQPGADRGEPLGNVASDVGGDQTRVEGLGIGPDRAQAVLDCGIAKLAQRDSIGGPIGEKAIVATVAGVVEIEFKGATDIERDDKRRPRRFGQALGIAARLPERPAHQLVVAARLGILRVIDAGQRRQFADVALLRFEDEVTALVEIDESGSAGFSAARHGSVNAVVVVRARRFHA